MMTEFDRGSDPMTTMTVLMAIRWAVKAWNVDVSQETIQNCYIKALSGQSNSKMVDSQLLQELQEGLNKLKISSVNEVMSIDQFLNHPEEDVVDRLEDLDNLVLSLFGPGNDLSDDGDVVMEDPHKFSIDEILEYLYKIRMYEEQQPQGHERLLSILPHYEEALLQRKKNNQRQSDIRSFFS